MSFLDSVAMYKWEKAKEKTWVQELWISLPFKMWGKYERKLHFGRLDCLRYDVQWNYLQVNVKNPLKPIESNHALCPNEQSHCIQSSEQFYWLETNPRQHRAKKSVWASSCDWFWFYFCLDAKMTHYILIRYPAQTNIKHLSCNKQPQLGCVNTSRVRPSLLSLNQQNGWK